ncbi:acetoacetate decarboxylase family protein [Emticicia sp. C21]|uniref:acetoacetate decarboxylase family protein n=1 Tax=Emticicia sp. C21 TaxID=2302915 RepID=UPI000E34C72A|nr:acetoacetate decarboxylase family protein [Emticicia sp. C21]RFS16265.1 hypothetical protein D0T08_11285 [Emticicia sp. C21]
MSLGPTQIAPPPWKLTGNGYVFLFRFSKVFVQEQGFLDDFQKSAYKHGLLGLGTVMFLDYTTSNVGPYRELLFVPGKFDFSKASIKTWGVSKIYVSSYNSVWNGRENWGIPKELADFNIQKISEREEIIEVKTNNEVFFKARLKKGDFNFPVTTKFFPLKLAQKLHNDLLITHLSTNGKASFAKLSGIKVNSQYFPDISQAKLLAIVSIKNFKMTFPFPKVINDYFKKR